MIRPAMDTDAAAMAEVLSNWIDETPWMPRLHTRDEDFGFCEGLLKRTEVWVADPATGFGFLARDGNSIEALYLSRDARRKSWGRALLAAVMQDREHLSLWTFQANVDAVAFYKAHGFHISEVTAGQGNVEKLPDFYMTWTKAS